jgi:hypothetical protein
MVVKIPPQNAKSRRRFEMAGGKIRCEYRVFLKYNIEVSGMMV